MDIAIFPPAKLPGQGAGRHRSVPWGGIDDGAARNLAAVILDLFSRKVVGWAMGDHLRQDLTIAALTMRPARRLRVTCSPISKDTTTSAAPLGPRYLIPEQAELQAA